jgi:hypothetical protein
MSEDEIPSTDKIRKDHEDHTTVRKVIALEASLHEFKITTSKNFKQSQTERQQQNIILREIQDAIVRLETLQEQKSGTDTHESRKNPLNRSVGSLLGEVFVTSIKTLGVAAVSALILWGLTSARIVHLPSDQPKDHGP